MLALLLAVFACKDEAPPSQDPDGTSTTADTTTTGTTTGSSSTASETVGESESTTGPSGCMEDVDCPDGETPLCGAMGECVRCDDPTAGGDEGCAAKDGSVCAEEGPRAGQCVECTEDAGEACTGVPPLCDLETNTCLPCTEHGQCGEAACNLFIGECLPGDAVVHVGPGERFGTLGEAIGSFEEGAAGTIVVHQANFDEAATVDGGRVLAFLAAEGDLPRWALLSGGSPQLTVADATVLMDGLQLSGNAATAHPALRVTGGRAWLDRGRVVGNDGGGVVAEEGAELVLRNCFVGGDVNNRDALMVDAATASLVYTTVLAGDGGLGQSRALVCSGASEVFIRNSLLVAIDDVPELECPMADVSYSATETEITGAGNSTLGDIQIGWFINETNDFHLDSPPPAIETTAQWQLGDPPFDIDGDPRPTTDGDPDYAGADAVP